MKRSSPTILTCFSMLESLEPLFWRLKRLQKRLNFIKMIQRIMTEILRLHQIGGRTICWQCLYSSGFGRFIYYYMHYRINVLNKAISIVSECLCFISESYQQYRKAAKTVYGDDADSKIKFRWQRILIYQRMDIGIFF